MKENTINLQGNGNIVIQDAQGRNITINTDDPPDILHKLQQLNATQIAVIKQLADEHTSKLNDSFKTLLSGVISQKNIVHGKIYNVSSVNGEQYITVPAGSAGFRYLVLTYPQARLSCLCSSARRFAPGSFQTKPRDFTLAFF